MSILRTPDVEVDQDFEAFAEITKAYVDETTGRRHIVGVATGVAEDRDGERVSKNAIIGMGRKIRDGGVKVTSSHQQDWMTEIGDVVKYEHDPETDEMIVDAALPAEGEDPIADKAWKTANTQRVGWSIGGKLRSSFFEKTELGKKRKVLDAIDLKHIMLTKNPAYPESFAHAVAKTWDGEAPADDEFTIESEVEKDMSTGSWVNGGSDSGGGNTGRDSVGSGQRNAGSKSPKTRGMSTEEDGSNDDDNSDDQKLPKAANERHLACPNCGHEFAADLPLDPEERQVDDTGDDNAPDNKDDQKPTGKSATKDDLMSKLNETLDALKALAAADDVTKTTDPEPDTTEATEVEKTDGPTDVEKMVAASHMATADRIETLEKNASDAFELIAKSHKAIMERIEDLPQGRRSVARILPPATGHDTGEVEKTTEQQADEAPDAVSALKILNRARYGV